MLLMNENTYSVLYDNTIVKGIPELSDYDSKDIVVRYATDKNPGESNHECITGYL